MCSFGIIACRKADEQVVGSTYNEPQMATLGCTIGRTGEESKSIIFIMQSLFTGSHRGVSPASTHMYNVAVVPWRRESEYWSKPRQHTELEGCETGLFTV
eukprot:gb/GECG01009601.1/.p1 GENE.gb/GECG01009601.1/~~gb/GECG01009601.1/.p1  ORF type:complete len:100 (+),score=3.07 gb/GECG01009601.1/:1-300(+)